MQHRRKMKKITIMAIMTLIIRTVKPAPMIEVKKLTPTSRFSQVFFIPRRYGFKHTKINKQPDNSANQQCCETRGMKRFDGGDEYKR